MILDLIIVSEYENKLYAQIRQKMAVESTTKSFYF